MRSSTFGEKAMSSLPWRSNKRALTICLVFGVCMLLFADQACAGMPSPPTLTTLAKARLHIVSFFIVTFLVMSYAVLLIWNSMRKSFPALPKLTYRRAMVFVGLWGAVFVLILTMIAGARELMTPGAWKKSGAIYKLDEGK